MRVLGSLLILGATVGCDAPSIGGHDVRFELGEMVIEVDSSSLGYTTTTTQPIIARGRDSLGLYLVALRHTQGVSLNAGEKLEAVVGFAAVENGRGKATRGDYSSKCSTYSRGDCLEKWVDPEFQFEILGYVPVTLQHPPR